MQKVQESLDTPLYQPLIISTCLDKWMSSYSKIFFLLYIIARLVVPQSLSFPTPLVLRLLLEPKQQYGTQSSSERSCWLWRCYRTGFSFCVFHPPVIESLKLRLMSSSFGMILTTFVLKRYNNEVQTSEMFSTAGRTVKSGLVASAVVSSWTWLA